MCLTGGFFMKEFYTINRSLYSYPEWYDLINEQEDLPYKSIVIDEETEEPHPDYISVFDVNEYKLYHKNVVITDFYVLTTFLECAELDMNDEEQIFTFINNADSFEFKGIDGGFKITKTKNKITKTIKIGV